MTLAVAFHCPHGPVSLAACLQLDGVCYNAQLQEQRLALHYPDAMLPYVFRLAAELAEAVLELSSEAEGDDPSNALDEARPDWRRTMPLALEDERARELLAGLLKEAARNQAAPVDEFRLERPLCPTGTGRRIGARLRLPATVPAETLARQIYSDRASGKKDERPEDRGLPEGATRRRCPRRVETRPARPRGWLLIRDV